MPQSLTAVDLFSGCGGMTLGVVLNSGETKTPNEELMQDFMALIASFSGKFYRLRGWQEQRKLLAKTQAEVDARDV